MTQTTPNPNPETETEQATQEFHFIPGDLEPIASDRPSKSSSNAFKLPDFINPNLVKKAFRPMLFGALGIHGFLLFVPLTISQQVKPKETAEPVKLSRLSDKVLVKSMPKVKVTSLPKAKPDLPKVAVAPSNPIVIKSDDEKPKAEPEKSPEKKPDETKPEAKKDDTKAADTKGVDTKQSDKGADPKTVDPKKATTDEKEAGKLDEGTQKFAPIINGLNKAFNPQEETAPVPEAEQLTEAGPFFKVTPPPVTGAVISNQEVDAVVSGLQSSFPEKFAAQGTYGGTTLYEAKVGDVTRYISVVKADNVYGQNVLVFLWEKPPA
jgi:hypothetical protein